MYSKRRAVACVAACGAVSAALTACGSTIEVDPAAEALAAAVESGDFSDVPLDEVSAEQAATIMSEVTGDLVDVARSVAVLDIERSGDDDDLRAVTFDLTWDLDASGTPGDSDDDWTYSTSTQARLADDEWLVQWDPSVIHPDLTGSSTFVVRRSQAERATILGADGEPIVTDRTVYRFGIDKTHVEGDLQTAAEQLAELVGVDVESFVSRTVDAGDKAFVEAITFREADASDVLTQVDDIDGARALEDTMALAPTREFARPILGTAGEATAEIVEESDGAVEQGDIVGLSGIQHQYDERLRGRPGMTVEIMPNEGENQVVYELAAAPGEPLAVTLDTRLQQHAESVLADVEPASAIVAVRPSTGGVVAAASGSGGGGHTTATLGQYAPGSTFKVVTALALLRSGFTPETAVECASEVVVDGKAFTNYSDYPSEALGEIPLRSAIAHSCNTALIGQRDAVTQEALAEAAAALGIGTGHDAGVVAYLGDVPAEAASTEHAASMIGQGKVLASPLAMATVAASVAAGHTVAPYLVGEPPEAGDSALTAGEAETLRDFMYAVVSEGSATFLGDVAGDPVGAKTGTAEYGDDSPPRTHAWMIAIQGDMAVAVFVEDGESGSQTAGPLLEAFLAGAT